MLDINCKVSLWRGEKGLLLFTVDGIWPSGHYEQNTQKYCLFQSNTPHTWSLFPNPALFCMMSFGLQASASTYYCQEAISGWLHTLGNSRHLSAAEG